MANVMLDAIAEFADTRQPQNMRLVRIIVFNLDILDTFRQEIMIKATSGKKPGFWKTFKNAIKSNYYCKNVSNESLL